MHSASSTIRQVVLDRPRLWRTLATLTVAPVLLVLSLFTVGETLGGDLSGLSHLLQLIPLVLVIVLGWRYPRLSGVILVAVGLLLALGFALLAWDSGSEVGTILPAEVLLLTPPIAAGLMFLQAARADRQRSQV